LHHFKGFPYAWTSLRAWDLVLAQSVHYVLPDGHMGKQCIVLKYGIYMPFVGRYVCYVFGPKIHFPSLGTFEASDDSE